MNICDVYNRKNIFVTGGSGFIGKVLIEKILRIFPDVGNIYVLIRSKKGKTPQERLKLILDNMLFDKIRSTNPEVLKKVIAIEGDVGEVGLGISDEDRQTLIDNVHIIFHAAASVKFDDPLPYAIKINVRSTRDIIEIAKEAKNLLLFVHVSTTYCNTDKIVVKEKLYPPHGNWRDAIRLAEEGDQGITDAFTQKYIKPLANTYTYAKSLAEHVVADLCKDKFPTLIVRPSVVISIIKEPVRGWNDNLNGPVGLLVAGGKGLLRTVYGNRDSIQDYIPVDSVVSLLLYTAYLKIKEGEIGEVEVYNCTKHRLNDVTTGTIVDMGARLIWDSPFTQVLWYPRFSMTNCFYSYYIQVLLFHMLPAFFLDILLRIVGKKPMVVSIQRKIFIANTILAYFIENTWYFENHKAMALQETMPPEDRESFSFEEAMKYNLDGIYKYFRDSKVMAGINIFKEKMDLEANRKQIYRLWLLDITLRCIFSAIFLWYLFSRWNVLQYLSSKMEKYMYSL